MKKILDQIREHAGLFDRSDRILLAILGPDRGQFLQNLLTNEVKRLAVGQGCEAFVTSTQGKTLAYVTVLAAAEGMLVRTDPGGADALLPHLEKYGVFEDVAIEDFSAMKFEYHLAGPAAAEILRRAGGQLPEELDLAFVRTELDDRPVRVIRESPTPLAGFTLIGDGPRAQPVREIVLRHGRDLGLVEAGPEIFEILRIEAGTPVFGQDITDKNLPQEIGRDARAISFVKGCYLGQETVARLDALGHVNQVLSGLVFEPGLRCPEPGAPLEDGGKRVGVVTSAAFSPARNAPVALAIVRTTHAAPGTKVQVRLPGGGASIVATVSGFPLKPTTADPG